MADEERRSQNPVDLLVRMIIGTGLAPTSEQRDMILERIAAVPFPTAGIHLRQRIADGQWNPMTTETEFVADLRAVALHPNVQVAA